MSKNESHRDLFVWQKAMDLTVQIFGLASLFPQNEIYRLTSPITQAAASVPANIAEGQARVTRNGYAHFLAIARCSLMGTETFLMIAVRLSCVRESRANP